MSDVITLFHHLPTLYLFLQNCLVAVFIERKNVGIAVYLFLTFINWETARNIIYLKDPFRIYVKIK